MIAAIAAAAVYVAAFVAAFVVLGYLEDRDEREAVGRADVRALTTATQFHDEVDWDQECAA